MGIFHVIVSGSSRGVANVVEPLLCHFHVNQEAAVHVGSGVNEFSEGAAEMKLKVHLCSK